MPMDLDHDHNVAGDNSQSTIINQLKTVTGTIVSVNNGASNYRIYIIFIRNRNIHV